MKLIYFFSAIFFSGLTFAELDMDGKKLQDSCEIAALDIILEKSSINSTPNEPFYKFRGIKRIVLEDIIYARGPLSNTEYELYEATLFEEYDGDAPTGIEKKFYAVVDPSVDCK